MCLFTAAYSEQQVTSTLIKVCTMQYDSRLNGGESGRAAGCHQPSWRVSRLWGCQSEGRSGRHLACFPEAFHFVSVAVLSTDGPFQQTVGHASSTIRPAVYVSHHIGTAVAHNVWSSDNTLPWSIHKGGLLLKLQGSTHLWNSFQSERKHFK